MSDGSQRRPFRLDPSDVIFDDWTAEEANLVYDVLIVVPTAIFDRYEDEMLAPLDNGAAPTNDDGVPPERYDSFCEDDIPF